MLLLKVKNRSVFLVSKILKNKPYRFQCSQSFFGHEDPMLTPLLLHAVHLTFEKQRESPER